MNCQMLASGFWKSMRRSILHITIHASLHRTYSWPVFSSMSCALHACLPACERARGGLFLLWRSEYFHLFGIWLGQQKMNNDRVLDRRRSNFCLALSNHPHVYIIASQRLFVTVTIANGKLMYYCPYGYCCAWCALQFMSMTKPVFILNIF